MDITLSSKSNQIKVQVQDYGIGISDDEIDKIFDPFYRSKKVMAHNGYGIGLSLVKRILTILNGEIYITSKLDSGSKVVIIFNK